MLDIGAYHGAYSLDEAAFDPDLVVHAFEPIAWLAKQLIEKATSNYFVHNSAVSECDGIQPFHINAFEAASSLLPMDEAQRSEWVGGNALREEHQIFVHTTRLDTFMRLEGIEAIDFLKIDAQGADLAVVKSAGKRLRDIDTIQLEVCITDRQLYIGGATKREICDFFHAADFDLVSEELQSLGQEENLTFRRRRRWWLR